MKYIYHYWFRKDQFLKPGGQVSYLFWELGGPIPGYDTLTPRSSLVPAEPRLNGWLALRTPATLAAQIGAWSAPGGIAYDD